MAGHNHNHGDQKLSIAVFINILLTIAQVIGGLISGSLSLVADALHNLSDAGAIIIAIIARRIGNKPANHTMTYGYKRAEIIAVLINSTTLILIGLYLIYEAINKYFNPSPIDGWIIVWIAGIALVIDTTTALLTYHSGAKDNMNIRAAFIHNVSDALASVVVIVAGALIILYQWFIVDLIATIGISIYVIYHGLILLKKSIMIMMQATPAEVSIPELKKRLSALTGVEKVQHIHVWQLDDKSMFFEGHIYLTSKSETSFKQEIREILQNEYRINHATLEIHQNKEQGQLA
tara:strand:- start:22884 stop:23756 length:873 start_codon:yes stop_codon:yes gene_type:complete